MRAIIDAGRFKYEDFLRITEGLEGVRIVGVLVHEEEGIWCNFPDWKIENTGIETWSKRQLIEETVDSSYTPYHEKYDAIRDSILGDARSHYLVEWRYGTGGSRTVFNHTLKLEHAIWNSLTILFRTRPHRVVHSNTPHDIRWIFSRVAELLGIDVYLTATTPLPWRTWVVKGLDVQMPVTTQEPHQKQERADMESIDDYILKCRSSYNEAIPSYEKIRRDKYKGKFFRIGTAIRSIVAARSSLGEVVSRVRSAYCKWSALKVYTRYASSFVMPQKYVILFLHYQPERTSLPEGYGYAQQWLMVNSFRQRYRVVGSWWFVSIQAPSGIDLNRLFET